MFYKCTIICLQTDLIGLQPQEPDFDKDVQKVQNCESPKNSEKSSPEITFSISDELKVLLQDIQNQVWKCTGQMMNAKSGHT